jgi:AAA family ATP:ADP antiporter
MLGLSALVFAGTVPLFLLLESRGRARGLSGAPPEAAAPPPTRGVLRAIAASPYLVFLTLTVALERMVPDFGYYAFGTAASRAFGTDGRAMGAFFASVNLWTNVASFALSALAAAPLLRWAGVGACLASSGLANLGLFVTFPFVPTLGVASFFYGADGATRYSLFKTAKETTYSSTDKEVVYRVKAFVEMFVYRFARGAAGFLLLAAGWLGGEERGALILGGLMALLWIYASLRVGREHAGLQRSAARPRRPLNA